MAGTLLWDFDGTLASRPRMWATACMAAVHARLGACPIGLDELDAHLGHGMPWHRPSLAYPDLGTAELWWQAVRDRITAVLISHGCTPNEASLVAEDVQDAIIDPTGYELFPDVHDALDLAEQAGWRSAVVSNHIPELADVLHGLAIGHRLDWVLTSAAIGYEKPHPQIFQQALERVRTNGVWMIGDNEQADCAGATAVGIPAIHLRHSPSSHQPHAADAIAAVELILARAEGQAPQASPRAHR